MAVPKLICKAAALLPLNLQLGNSFKLGSMNYQSIPIKTIVQVNANWNYNNFRFRCEVDGGRNEYEIEEEKHDLVCANRNPHIKQELLFKVIDRDLQIKNSDTKVVEPHYKLKPWNDITKKEVDKHCNGSSYTGNIVIVKKYKGTELIMAKPSTVSSVPVATDPPRALSAFEQSINAAVDMIKNKKNIVILTGAGMSTSAGIPDFRSPNGLYNQKDRLLNDRNGPVLTMNPEGASGGRKIDMNDNLQTALTWEFFQHNSNPYHEMRRDMFLGLMRKKWKPTIGHLLGPMIYEKQNKLKMHVSQNVDALDKYAYSSSNMDMNSKMYYPHGQVDWLMVEEHGGNGIVIADGYYRKGAEKEGVLKKVWKNYYNLLKKNVKDISQENSNAFKSKGLLISELLPELVNLDTGNRKMVEKFLDWYDMLEVPMIRETISKLQQYALEEINAIGDGTELTYRLKPWSVLFDKSIWSRDPQQSVQSALSEPDTSVFVLGTAMATQLTIYNSFYRTEAPRVIFNLDDAPVTNINARGYQGKGRGFNGGGIPDYLVQKDIDTAVIHIFHKLDWLSSILDSQEKLDNLCLKSLEKLSKFISSYTNYSRYVKIVGDAIEKEKIRSEGVDIDIATVPDRENSPAPAGFMLGHNALANGSGHRHMPQRNAVTIGSGSPNSIRIDTIVQVNANWNYNKFRFRCERSDVSRMGEENKQDLYNGDSRIKEKLLFKVIGENNIRQFMEAHYTLQPEDDFTKSEVYKYCNGSSYTGNIVIVKEYEKTKLIMEKPATVSSVPAAKVAPRTGGFSGQDVPAHRYAVSAETLTNSFGPGPRFKVNSSWPHTVLRYRCYRGNNLNHLNLNSEETFSLEKNQYVFGIHGVEKEKLKFARKGHTYMKDTIFDPASQKWIEDPNGRKVVHILVAPANEDTKNSRCDTFSIIEYWGGQKTLEEV